MEEWKRLHEEERAAKKLITERISPILKKVTSLKSKKEVNAIFNKLISEDTKVLLPEEEKTLLSAVQKAQDSASQKEETVKTQEKAILPIQVRYLINSNTREIHHIQGITLSCKIFLMKEEHRMFVKTLDDVLVFLEHDYDGCAHCMERYHTR